MLNRSPSLDHILLQRRQIQAVQNLRQVLQIVLLEDHAEVILLDQAGHVVVVGIDDHGESRPKVGQELGRHEVVVFDRVHVLGPQERHAVIVVGDLPHEVIELLRRAGVDVRQAEPANDFLEPLVLDDAMHVRRVVDVELQISPGEIGNHFRERAIVEILGIRGRQHATAVDQANLAVISRRFAVRGLLEVLGHRNDGAVMVVLLCQPAPRSPRSTDA